MKFPAQPIARYYVAFKARFSALEGTLGAGRHMNVNATLSIKCGPPTFSTGKPLRSTWRGLETWQGRDGVRLAKRKSESTGNTNFDLNRRAGLRPYL
jgi:hypothetical protein